MSLKDPIKVMCELRASTFTFVALVLDFDSVISQEYWIFKFILDTYLREQIMKMHIQR